MLKYISFGGLAQLVRVPASHAGGRAFEPRSLHHRVGSGAKRASGLFCLFKTLKPAFYAFSVQRIFKFSPFGKKFSKTCDHISDHRQKIPRSKCCNFGRGFLCLCGSFFELFFHLFNKLRKFFLALLTSFGVYVPAYTSAVYTRGISSFVQMLIKL